MNASSFSLSGPKGGNEDAFLDPIEKDGSIFFAVADGVGGSRNGGEASKLAIAEAARLFRENPGRPYSEIFSAIHDAFNREALATSGAATTLSMLRVKDGVANVGHVGDSRIYHLRGEGIVSRTEDQTEIAELVREGIFSKAEAKRYRRKNVLTSALSAKGQYSLFECKFDVFQGDTIVACTDGVYGVLNKVEIRDLKLQSSDTGAFLEGLQRSLEERGIIDDSTAVAIRL